MIDTLDWTLVQAFVAVAEQGSLSGGARVLASSQPTMSRHIAALEAALDIRLFDRTGTGLEITPAGVELLEHAQSMKHAAGRFHLAAGGQTSRIAGPVRITASEIVSTYILPSVLTELRQTEPEIVIELVPSDRSENLLQREADIAVRMYRPTQSDVITRKVGDLTLGIFASHDYLARKGEPHTFDEFMTHDVIGYDKSDQMIDGFAAAGHKVGRDFFAFRCDNQVVCWEMVVAGFGVGFNQLKIGLTDDRVKRLLPNIDLPSLPVWLTAHAELKTSRRVRRVYDFLADRLAAKFSDA